MQLRAGTLMPNTETPVGEGINAATRAIIIVDGVQYAAIVKRIPLNAIIAECFSGMLFRAWNLPSPEPILLRHGSDLLYASMDAGYPNLKQRLGWSDDLPADQKEILAKICASIVCGWEDIPTAMAADEVIANADRNLGNFLWDGIDHSYIDHERSMGLYPQNVNLIAEFSKLLGLAEDMERKGVAAAFALDQTVLQNLHPAPGISFTSSIEYVQDRLRGLAARIIDRFPKPTDLLSGIAQS